MKAIPTVLTLIFLSPAAIAQTGTDGGMQSIAALNATLARAKREHRPVLLYFRTN